MRIHRVVSPVQTGLAMVLMLVAVPGSAKQSASRVGPASGFGDDPSAQMAPVLPFFDTLPPLAREVWRLAMQSPER